MGSVLVIAVGAVAIIIAVRAVVLIIIVLTVVCLLYTSRVKSWYALC